MDDDDVLIDGEKRDVWIEITERDGGTVTLSAYLYEIYDEDDVEIKASASASISGNGTATVKIYALFDTTVAGVSAGSYYMRFTYTIGSEIYKRDIWRQVK